MSRDLDCFFEKLGFDTYIVRGEPKDGQGDKHAWVIVDFFGHPVHIDSVSLFPIVPTMKFENYSYFENYNEFESFFETGLRRITKYD